MLRMLFENPLLILYRIPALLLAISVHEAAHGFVAYKLGDPTAKAMGRLTLNPLRHMNVVGTLMLLLFGFGFATPVPVNAQNFKRPKWDMALVALAGPLSNVILAIGGILGQSLLNHTVGNLNHPTILALYNLLYVFVALNVCFAVFNLIPIPPLDGSRILLTFLPKKLYFSVMQYERYIQIVFFVILMTGVIDGFLNHIFRIVIQALYSVFLF